MGQQPLQTVPEKIQNPGKKENRLFFKGHEDETIHYLRYGA